MFAGDTDAPVQPPKDTVVYIRGIEIYGNVTTRPEVLRHYLEFDKGEPLDTSKLRLTRANLVATNLYDKVDIFPHMREDGAHVFIILKEAVRLQLGYGAMYSTYRYGREDLWFRFILEAALANFRGRMEEISVGVRVWDYRSLDLSWYKPFTSTPYFMSLGAGIAAYPDYILPVDYVDVYSMAAVGRRFGRYSRLSVSAMPVYRNRALVESAIDSSSIVPQPFESDLYEAFAGLGFTTDRRSARFDPRKGWFLQSRLRTNRLYRGGNVPFFQLTTEARGYVPFDGGDVAALRLQLTLRDTDAGAYHRLAYGGAGQVRGYGEDALGWRFVANSSLLASVKYHKRLLETPPLPIPLVDHVFAGVKRVRFKFDATFMADYARLYEDNLGALTFGGRWQDGIGIGFGTRIIAPEVRQSGCVDVVFGRIDDRDGSRWEPTLHLYLDFFY